MPRYISKGLVIAVAVAASVLTASAPAQADCLRATVTYTSPTGSSTTLGRDCIASTTYNEAFRYSDSTGSTSAGSVTVSFGVPLP